MRTTPLILAFALAAACTGRNEGPAQASSPTGPAPLVAAPVVPPVPSAVPVPAPSAAPPASGLDPCILGTWRLTPENARAFYTAMMGASGAPVEIVSIEGTGVATMTAAGDTSLDMGNLRVVYRTTGPGAPPMEMTMSLRGTGHADFTTSNGTISYSNSTNEFSGSMSVTIGGTTRELPWNSALAESMAGPIRGQQTYRCTASELTLSMPEAPVPVVWIR